MIFFRVSTTKAKDFLGYVKAENQCGLAQWPQDGSLSLHSSNGGSEGIFNENMTAANLPAASFDSMQHTEIVA